MNDDDEEEKERSIAGPLHHVGERNTSVEIAILQGIQEDHDVENENDHLRILPHPGRTKRRAMTGSMENTRDRDVENMRDHDVEYENDHLRILPRPGRTKRGVMIDGVENTRNHDVENT